ncbi:hypothetical protein D3C85_1584410 [compost metagenome]
MRHQNRPQGTLADRKTDVGIVPGGAVVSWFHAQQMIGCFIEATVGIETGVIQGIGDCAAVRQAFTHLARAMGRGVALGCQPGNGFEYAMEVETAEARGVRQFIERR